MKKFCNKKATHIKEISKFLRRERQTQQEPQLQQLLQTFSLLCYPLIVLSIYTKNQAMKRGFIMAGKKIDYERCARTVLDEFRSAQIGRIML